MTFAAIGEYTFQTYGYSLWSSKLLDIWITKDMLPKKYKNITADILATFIMGFKKFKGRPLEFRINATNPPSLSFGDKVVNVGLELDVLTYVVLANKTKFLAMNLHAVSKASGNITVNDVKATAHVSLLTAHFSIKTSAVGFIPISVMNYF
uniref:Lipid-binding serum glycoprotein C-terminal domain-containing protein n=1 Tax=Ciona savignyi TaxID=51511 RepID=H2YXB6_CIOSA